MLVPPMLWPRSVFPPGSFVLSGRVIPSGTVLSSVRIVPVESSSEHKKSRGSVTRTESNSR